MHLTLIPPGQWLLDNHAQLNQISALRLFLTLSAGLQDVRQNAAQDFGAKIQAEVV